MAKMTERQKRFIAEYLIDLNATQAAIRAGYSVKTAGSIGDENLKKPEINSAIAKEMAKRSKRTGVNQDRVVLELAKIAFVNASDVIDAKNLGHKKVSDIFIDNKVSKDDRNKWPILVDSNNTILWIPGIKKSKFAKDKDKNYDIILVSERKNINEKCKEK